MEVFEAVDRPAQRATLIMGPKKPINYDKLQSHSSTMSVYNHRKSQVSNNSKIRVVEMEKSNQKVNESTKQSQV